MLELVLAEVGAGLVRLLSDIRKCLDSTKGIAKRILVKFLLILTPCVARVLQDVADIRFGTPRKLELNT